MQQADHDPEWEEYERERCAYHEAGHAVAHYLLGIPFTFVTIVPDRDLLILDGIPRDESQAFMMDEYITVKRVFHLHCSDTARMAERLKRRALKENRLDDASDEVIRRRWEVYEHESRPVLEHYGPDMVELVDALGSPVQVLHDLLGRLLRANLA